MVTLEDKVLQVESLLGEEHTVGIWSQSSGDEKINHLAQKISLLEVLVNNGFNGYHFALIVVGADWKEKLDYAESKYESLLKPMGFNGYHFALTVRNAGWKEKLDWVRDNYQNVMQERGFNPSQTAKILKGKGWVGKTRWIEDYFDPSRYSTADVTNLMQKKDWQQRLQYLAA